MTKITAYKGFDKDLRCRDFPYEVGKTYEHDGEVKACESGFHACEFPFDVWSYYPPADSRFAVVSQEGDIARHSADSKIASGKITVEAELTLPAFIQAGVDAILAMAKNTKANTGDQSAATNTGNQSVATNTGNRSAATNTGDWSAATNTGDWSAATNTGNQSVATNTGDQSVATNTGNQSVATNTGNRSAATNTGNRSAATNTGDWSAARVEGAHSVAASTGCKGKAAASEGSAIFLVERDVGGKILHVFAGIAGRDGIKPDTFYTLRDGKPV